jgi:predicted ArsR family transcriptional regulator
MEEKKEVTDILLKFKKEQQLTLQQLARVLGISKMTIHKRLKDHKWTKTQTFYIINKFK